MFLGQIHVDNGNALNAASHSLDSWKAITDQDVLRELQVQKPLLASTYDVKKSIDALRGEQSLMGVVSHPLDSWKAITDQDMLREYYP